MHANAASINTDMSLMKGNKTPKTVYLKDYTPPPFWIDHVRLRFELGVETTHVKSTLTLRRNAVVPSAGALRLDGTDLTLNSVAVDGRKLEADRYSVDEESLTLYDMPDRCEVTTEVQLRPQDNTELEGLYKSSGTFCTQCEAKGFRKITYYLDRPDVMARFNVVIVADQYACPVLLSNGNLIDSGAMPGNRHFVEWEDPFPKPCYLFALVAGRLASMEDRYITASGRAVTLRIFVEAHNIAKCGHAMRSLKRAMRWDEEKFGREYDLDTYMIVAVDDFNMGAMENKGLNLFNSKYVLADPSTATDADFMGVESVIAHEYFHNWTGTRVTCRDWFQLSLKEGLTVYRDQEFSADMHSRAVKRIDDVRVLRARQFSEDAGPMAHPVRPDSYIEVNNFYTVTVYEKGAEVIRMMHALLGKELFRQGMDLYFERHDGQAVTCDDFVQAMEDAGGGSLNQFKRWYQQAGTPTLTVSAVHDAGTATYTLYVQQSCPPTPKQPYKAPFHIPLRLGLLDKDGCELPLRLQGETCAQGTERVIALTEREQHFTFVDIPKPPIPSLLRGFSAPVRLRFEYSNEELAFLMAHDTESFNRWEAAQALTLKVLLQVIDARRQRRTQAIPEPYLRALRDLLAGDRQDPTLIAEAISLPDEEYIAEHLEVIDFEVIHDACEALRSEIGQALEPQLRSLYLHCRDQGEYTLAAEDIARRKLKNDCLGFLARINDEYVGVAEQQFLTANNMTDQIASLGVICNVDRGGYRDRVLAEFYRQWQSQRLVIDKWFAIQATSCLDDTYRRVVGLLQHPDFEITNPNRVRALIGGFCAGNPVRFHAADGSGYEFLAGNVLRIDDINPQVAARLLAALSRWKRFDSPNRTLMKTQLERILAKPDLSRDVYEIAAKILEN